MDKISEIKALLAQLKTAESDLQNQLIELQKNENPYYCPSVGFKYEAFWRNETKYMNHQEQFNNIAKKLDKTKKYNLITLTLGPQLHKLTEEDQSITLEHVMDKLREAFNSQFYSCIEKHKNGILHAHIMAIFDPRDHMDLLKKIAGRLRCDNSKRLLPTIKIDAVKCTEFDQLNTYRYILKDKLPPLKDPHPVYKDIKLYY